MNIVRWILGRLVLGYDLLTRPKPLTRDAAAQQELDVMTAKFALYQFNACPKKQSITLWWAQGPPAVC
jgi:hypothetical protein